MRKESLQKIFTKKRQFQVVGGIFVGVILIIAACVATITETTQPEMIVAGDSAHYTMKFTWTGTNNDRNTRLVVGICMPKSWRAKDNTVMYVNGSITNGNEGMSVIPPGNMDPSSGLPWNESFQKKFGIGPNLIDDMEWVTFWSDRTYFVPNGSNLSGTVYFTVKSSTDNLQFKPGYGFCETEDGLSDYFNGNPTTGYYAYAWGGCMLSEGDGDLQDFCNPTIGIVEPSSATKNDILTFKYDGNVDTSELKNESDIFLCVTGYTTTGQVLVMCDQNEETKMDLYDFKKWRIDFWPVKFFNLSESQELEKLEYYFTDQTGTMKVGFNNTTEPFKYTFKCQ